MCNRIERAIRKKEHDFNIPMERRFIGGFLGIGVGKAKHFRRIPR